MGGSFGKSAKDDGVTGTTKGKDKAGVFGHNEAKTAPTAGSAGGAGVFGLTAAPSAAGALGANLHATKGVGVQGNGPEAGVSGHSANGAGARGQSDHGNGVEAFGHDANANGLLALHDGTSAPTATDGAPHGTGVLAVTTVPGSAGVFGANNSDHGVGVQGNGPESGLSGYSHNGSGARAFSDLSNGVEGFAQGESLLVRPVPGRVLKQAEIVRLQRQAAQDAQRFTAVQPRLGGTATPEEALDTSLRIAERGGWLAQSTSAREPARTIGVHVSDVVPIGIRQPVDNRPKGNGVWGHTKAHHGSGVFGSVEPGITDSAGVTGVGATAGQFFGNVAVTGALGVGSDVNVVGNVNVGGDVRLSGADFAEDFDAARPLEAVPGTVMVIDPAGGLKPSDRAYDRAVAGVVSGAGSHRPGIVLDSQPGAEPRVTVALVGKVFCRVDATYGAVEVGDLLTTSPTTGHAMRATDRDQAFGSILGKAMQAMADGQGLIPILVALQ